MTSSARSRGSRGSAGSRRSSPSAALLAQLEGLPSARQLREENERLRRENEMLEQALENARPDSAPYIGMSVPASARSARSHRSLESSDNQGAANRLMKLMREGGELLREREELEKENRLMMGELVDHGSAPSSPAGGSVEFRSTRDSAAFRSTQETAPGVPEGDEGDLDEDEPDELDESSLEKLLPLLSEGDSLRAEREALRKEREDLLGALAEPGGPFNDKAAEERRAQEAEDEEIKKTLELAFQNVQAENRSIGGEVDELKAANAKLRETHRAEMRALERARQEQAAAKAALEAAAAAAKAEADRLARERAEAEAAKAEAEALARAQAEAQEQAEFEARQKAEARARQRAEMAQMRAEAQARMTGSWQQQPPPASSYGGYTGMGAFGGYGGGGIGDFRRSGAGNASRLPPVHGFGRRSSLLGAGATMMRAPPVPPQASMPTLPAFADDEDTMHIRQREATAQMLKSHSKGGGLKYRSDSAGRVRFTVPKKDNRDTLSMDQEMAMRSQLQSLCRSFPVNNADGGRGSRPNSRQGARMQHGQVACA